MTAVEQYADFMKKLNTAQQEAVCATEGYVRVIAGAGSGKTRALSHRFAFLVNELGILPGNILCVTFTNKSANEMRQRIHYLTGDNDTGYINTFHGFCVSVLQEDSYAAGYPKSFLVLDNSDIDAMLQIIYEERGLTLRDMTFAMARDMIEIQKLFKRPDYYKDMIALPLEALKEKYDQATRRDDIIFYGYLYQEKKCFGLDYNDLIKFTLFIFKEREEICRKWQQRLEYIMIDEFQDIDFLQYELMEVLCAWHRNLFVVGDPDQTIYTWRGADGRFLRDFDTKFPGTRTIMMMENYRSTQPILAAANSLIEKNKFRLQKRLLPLRSGGPPVVCHFADTQEAEAKWICNEIRRLQAEGADYGDITLLYRAHYVTRTIEQVFLQEKIPYTIYSGVQFFDRMEVKDSLSYLRMIAYKDDLSFRRIVNTPKRNMGKRRLAFLEEYAAEHGCTLYQALTETLDDPIFKGTRAGQFVTLVERYASAYEDRPVSEMLSALLNESGYEKMLRTEGSQERLDNVAELKQSVYEYETTCGEEVSLPHYLTHVALFTNADSADSKGKVKLMTVHAAKGLEFSTVFLCGMNEGIFPSRKVRTLEAMEEERRLAFVAVTRAKDRLYLSRGAGRNFDGSPQYPSRFILEIDSKLLHYTKEPRAELIKETREYIGFSQKYMPEKESDIAFSIGQRVRHAVFGAGTVTGVDRDKCAHLVQFDSIDTPRNISFRAKLEKI